MRINGKKIHCPRSYEELKTRHYQRIVTEWQPEEKDLYKKDFFKLFCILTDTDYASFVKTPENEAAIWESVRWFVEQPFKFDEKPPVMLQVGFKWLVLPKTVRIPKSTGTLSIGQNIVVKQRLEKSKYPDGDLAFVTAVFLQPIYDNAQFDMDRVKDLENIILEMPIAKIYPIGFFLLNLVAMDGIRHYKIYSRTKRSLISNSVRQLHDWLTSIRLGSGRITT